MRCDERCDMCVTQYLAIVLIRRCAIEPEISHHTLQLVFAIQQNLDREVKI